MRLSPDTYGLANHLDGNPLPKLYLIRGSCLEKPIAHIDVVYDPRSGIRLPLYDPDDPAVFLLAQSQAGGSSRLMSIGFG